MGYSPDERNEREVTIAEMMLLDSKRGKYARPTMEPPGFSYLRTYGDGQLRQVELQSIDYDDFDLYVHGEDGTYCYRFWKKLTDEGKESGRSYSEPLLGFASETAAVEDALSVYRGERAEYRSEELREWRAMAQWVFVAIMLKSQLLKEPERLREVEETVIAMRAHVHPSPRAQLAWKGLESTLSFALSNARTEASGTYAPSGNFPLAPVEWRYAKQWEVKLQRAWTKLEKAHHTLQNAIKVQPAGEEYLLDDVQTSLLEYLDIARKVQDKRTRSL